MASCLPKEGFEYISERPTYSSSPDFSTFVANQVSNNCSCLQAGVPTLTNVHLFETFIMRDHHACMINMHDDHGAYPRRAPFGGPGGASPPPNAGDPGGAITQDAWGRGRAQHLAPASLLARRVRLPDIPRPLTPLPKCTNYVKNLNTMR